MERITEKDRAVRYRKDEGYPPEYIVSRVRGRRLHLITDWRGVLESPDPVEYLKVSRYGVILSSGSDLAIQEYSEKEHLWLYSRMDKTLKRIFEPVISFFRLETLIDSLRYRVKERGGLITDALRAIIKEIDEGGAFLSEDIQDGYRRGKGPGWIEYGIRKAYLEHMITGPLHRIIRDFFVYIVDMRNVITLSKLLRWRREGLGLSEFNSSDFIRGGKIPAKRLSEALKKDDLRTGIESLTGTWVYSCINGLSTPHEVERALLLNSLKYMRRLSREPSGIGLILEYMWRVYVEAVNLRLLLRWRHLGRAILDGEIIKL